MHHKLLAARALPPALEDAQHILGQLAAQKGAAGWQTGIRTARSNPTSRFQKKHGGRHGGKSTFNLLAAAGLTGSALCCICSPQHDTNVVGHILLLRAPQSATGIAHRQHDRLLSL